MVTRKTITHQAGDQKYVITKEDRAAEYSFFM